MIVKVEELKEKIDINIILENLKDIPDLAILDSSLNNENGRYSIIGLNKYLDLEYGDRFLVNGEVVNRDFRDYLKEVLKENNFKSEYDLPIISGGIGYLSYEFGKELLNIKFDFDKGKDIPLAKFMFFDNFIIVDHHEGKTYITSAGKLKGKSFSINDIYKLISKKLDIEDVETKIRNDINIKSNFTHSEYLKAVERVKDYIYEGDIYIMNLTQILSADINIDSFGVFKTLRKINPAPFASYLRFDGFEIVSSSVERFIKLRDGRLYTEPIKGTRKRGKTMEEDFILKEELRNSEKDKSELLMIVDLERNDLSKICKINTVNVDELYKIDEYATVFHLVSKISGEIKEGKDFIDIISAMFPGGSITGAPKIRAMEIIDEIEGINRGIYTGSIGYLSFHDTFDFNIVIRTLLFKDEKFHLGVGGGITCESELEFEFLETLQKARALLDSMGLHLDK